MIIDTYKDYTVSEMAEFAKLMPDRYKKLCEIVGEFSLGIRGLYLSIVIPYNEDMGCVVASVNRDEKFEVIDTRYF